MNSQPSEDERDDGWAYSTEGDLDPDLTEEAGYSAWEPPRRAWVRPLVRTVFAITLLAMVLGVLASLR